MEINKSIFSRVNGEGRLPALVECPDSGLRGGWSKDPVDQIRRFRGSSLPRQWGGIDLSLIDAHRWDRKFQRCRVYLTPDWLPVLPLPLHLPHRAQMLKKGTFSPLWKRLLVKSRRLSVSASLSVLSSFIWLKTWELMQRIKENKIVRWVLLTGAAQAWGWGIAWSDCIFSEKKKTFKVVV